MTPYGKILNGKSYNLWGGYVKNIPSAKVRNNLLKKGSSPDEFVEVHLPIIKSRSSEKREILKQIKKEDEI